MSVSYVLVVSVLTMYVFLPKADSICTIQTLFTITPLTQLVSLGDTNIQIHCAATPNETCLWVWNIYNATSNVWIQISGNSTFATSGAFFLPDGSLFIPNITTFHATNYKCLTAGANPSPVATIYLRTQLQYVNGMASVCVDPGTNGSFPFMTIGYPVPNLTLYKMGSQGQWTPVTDSRFAVTVSSVAVMAAMGTDNGMYLINATNSYSSNQLTFRLNVSGLEAPILTLSSKLSIVLLNQPSWVSCSVQPAAVQYAGCGGQVISSNVSIVWMREGSKVTQDPFQPVYANSSANGASILMFQSLQKSQVGLYTCLTSSIMGNSTTNFQIYGPPDPVSNLLSSVNQGVVTFSWTPPTPGPFVISYSLYYGPVNANVTSIHNTNASSAWLSGLQAGNYTAYVVTIGKVPTTTVESAHSAAVQFTVVAADTLLPSAVINGVIAGAIVLVVVVGIVMMCTAAVLYTRRQRSYQITSWVCDEKAQVPSTDLVPPISLPSNMDIPGSLRLSSDYEVDPKWEFPREALQFSEMLYEGCTTVLYRGVASGLRGDRVIDVAIKMRKAETTDDVRMALLADMEQLASLGSHPNIVGLLRVCTVESPICMVVEYMCHGDLLGFLRASRGHHGMYTVFPGGEDSAPQVSLTSRDLMSIAAKIASGMAFLSEKKVVHGSLCASNVLVGTSLDIKINLRVYELSSDCVLKWMAPETLFDGTSTTYSDVWSFGVTLWEVVTLGGTPYAEILAEDLYPQLANGMRLPHPSHCAQEVYDIMKACWGAVPTSRPPFDTLQANLDTLSHVVLLDFGLYEADQYSQFNDNSLTTLL